jgi:hypothetical protein
MGPVRKSSPPVLWPILIEGENSMNALNSVAVAISGLVFAGAAALTAGAALPANAGVAVSVPHMMSSHEDKAEGGEVENRQENNCVNSLCQNMAFNVAGDGNSINDENEEDGQEEEEDG